MVKLTGTPLMLPPLPSEMDGVTVIVAVISVIPGFCARKAGISPVPLAASEMDGSLFVQLYVTPGVLLLNTTGLVSVCAQTTWLGTGFILKAGGATVIVKLIAVPEQDSPLLVLTGVTVIVAVAAVTPGLIAVKAPIFPEPLAARPIDGLSLTHV